MLSNALYELYSIPTGGVLGQIIDTYINASNTMCTVSCWCSLRTAHSYIDKWKLTPLYTSIQMLTTTNLYLRIVMTLIDIISSDWHVPITNSESDNPMSNAYTNQSNVECVLTEIKPMSNAYRNLKMSNAYRKLKMSNFKQKTNSVQAQTDEIKN